MSAPSLPKEILYRGQAFLPERNLFSVSASEVSQHFSALSSCPPSQEWDWLSLAVSLVAVVQLCLSMSFPQRLHKQKTTLQNSTADGSLNFNSARLLHFRLGLPSTLLAASCCQTEAGKSSSSSPHGCG